MKSTFTKMQNAIKLIQLIILFLFGLTYFLVLFLNTELKNRVYSDPALFFLCVSTWIFLLVGFIFLFLDFYHLRSFAEESHTLNKMAYLDSLTGIPNRYSCDLMFQMYSSSESMEHIGCILLEIQNLIGINQLLGREVGDALLSDFSMMLEDIIDDRGFVGRNSGNEFLYVLENSTKTEIEDFLNTLNRRLENYNKLHDAAPILVRSEYVLNSEAHSSNFSELLTLTYNKLHSQNKS